MKKVTTIAAKTREEIKGRPLESRLRVCAYCRVSSNSSEQMESFDTQVAYYTEYINSKPEWEFAGVYADSGISGTGSGESIINVLEPKSWDETGSSEDRDAPKTKKSI